VDVPVILQTDYFRRDDETTIMPVSMELQGEGLKFEEKGPNREGKFEFVAQVTTEKGAVTGVARDSVAVRLPADRAEKLKSGGIFYSTGFQLKPGNYKLKFLVRDNLTGKLGSFEQPIRVPALTLKKLSTSSIVLANQVAGGQQAGAGAGVTHQGTMRRFQEMGPRYDPLSTRNGKIVPSIGNVFVPRQTVYVYFQVYGAAADKKTERPCIETDLVLIRNNKKILETQPQYVQEWTQGQPAGRGGPWMMQGGPMAGMAGADRRIGEATVAISLPLRNLKKGDYVLQVHVRDAVADINQFQRVPVVIQ